MTDRRLNPRRVLVAALLVLGAGFSAAPSVAVALPPIRHVFVVVLENQNFETTFGPSSKAPYLARDLVSQGALVSNYYGIGHQSLDDYVAMVSGQGPNPVTQADCQVYQDVLPGTPGPDGQAAGSGCVYPATVPTISNQLEARGLSWRGYMEDMGNSTTQPRECRHPATGSQDDTQSARLGDQYAARHNPFVYFHSITDRTADCAANDVPLDRLASDLRSAQSTPNFAFITPNLCHDGHDAPCVDGQPGGEVSIDGFLRQWVPMILQSPAYQQDGLLAVIFDETSSGSEACCGERSANTPNAGGTSSGPGGGRTGAVLLSRFIAPGTRTAVPYNHYALLRSVEDVFGLSHLGYAGQNGLAAFGDDVFTARSGPPPPQAPAGGGPGGCTEAALPARKGRRWPRGSVIASARVIGHRRRQRTLLLTLRHSARVIVRVGRRGRRSRRHSRALAPCTPYRIALRHRRGRVVVSAATGGARERRRL